MGGRIRIRHVCTWCGGSVFRYGLCDNGDCLGSNSREVEYDHIDELKEKLRVALGDTRPLQLKPHEIELGIILSEAHEAKQ